MDISHFFIAAFALLILPGPTNTVLAFSAEGLTPLRFTSLLAIAVSAYAAVVIAVSGIGGPLRHEHRTITQGVKLLAATWVSYLAIKLWAPYTANAACGYWRKATVCDYLAEPEGGHHRPHHEALTSGHHFAGRPLGFRADRNRYVKRLADSRTAHH
ncbi:hypothetical protein QA646_29580 (plasmid) [Rhizobium sp. CB3090]|uniref:hypothetical protein n=1 Tax=Rhizobium sp. CB3090 TaxID=3039156 RepID=UPI0024B0870E|nr:hypothetical protein [Rhizobium sp. CB3090]WFU13359.1 hypothetical protein QA646_29580 [Rhizobium sp. CB3090]